MVVKQIRWFDADGNLGIRYSTVFKGETLNVSEVATHFWLRMSAHERRLLEDYLHRRLRRKLMAEIESRLFNG